MKYLYAVIITLCSLLLFSCASTSTEDEVVTDPYSVTISLPENPSTGYTWLWQQMGSGKIALVSDEYVPDNSPEGMAGTGGTRTFTFKGITPGHVTLTMTEKRPWEGGETAGSEIYSITIYSDMHMTCL